MGRLSKVERFNLGDKISVLRKEGKSCKQIAFKLRAEGFELSEDAVSREINKQKKEKKQQKEEDQRNKIVIDALVESPESGAQLVEALSDGLLQELYKYFSEQKLEIKNLNEFSTLMAQSVNAKMRALKWRFDFEEEVKTAKKQIIEALRSELGKDPDLVQRISALVETVRINTP